MPASTPCETDTVGASGGVCAAEATLSDWAGHFAVENAAAFTFADFPYAQSNGAATQQCASSDDDSDSEAVGAAQDRWPTAQPGSTSGRQRGADSPTCSGRCSSTNRGVISGAAAGLRLGVFSRQSGMGSSLLGDSMTEIRLEDLQNDHEPTSALLDYCKRKFLRPYLAILSLVALNPVSTDTTLCRTCLSYTHALLVLLLLICGYALQFVCAYRGDRGFSNFAKDLPKPPIDLDDTDSGGAGGGGRHTIGALIFGHVIPNGLSLSGYLAAVLVCKLAGQEQLQNLIERSFLMSLKPRQLCRMLWMYVCGGVVLLALLFAYVLPSVLLQGPFVAQFEWLAQLLVIWPNATKAALLTALFLQDLVEIVILSSYCIECYLLREHLETLSYKLLMHSIDSQDWMREMLEFRKLLDHLNQRVAIPVCFYIVMNLAYAFAGLVYLFNDFDFHYAALQLVVLNIVNVSLWLLMGLLPFFAAAAVTRGCQRAQGNGHQIRVRPFVYHNTSAEDLNSTLLFASSLEMSAKLFRMPIQSNYLCFAILVVSIVVLTLGMCVNLIDFGSF